jgi:hypothetical protein
MARCPFAIWHPLNGPAGPFTSGPFKIVHHTTEGSTAKGAFAALGSAHADSHFVVDATDIYQLVDTGMAVATCAREEGDTLTRKTCWHGIGKYLARRDAQEAAQACARTTPEWRGNCFHGLGWGAAERDADAALAACAGFGAFADNCRQGVAHQQKRVDPARAVSLCQSLRTASLRDRCLAFVRR